MDLSLQGKVTNYGMKYHLNMVYALKQKGGDIR